MGERILAFGTTHATFRSHLEAADPTRFTVHVSFWHGTGLVQSRTPGFVLDSAKS
jgi:hypothetical protein